LGRLAGGIREKGKKCGGKYDQIALYAFMKLS
jgi:hypothetical protein